MKHSTEFVMQAIRLSLLLLLFAFAAPTQAAPDADGFERIALIHHADVDISLLFRPTATPAEPEFIGFLIDNKAGRLTDRGLNGSYRIEAEFIDRATKARVSTATIGTGNQYDLLYRDVIDHDILRPTLPRGEFRRTITASNYALGQIGIPASTSKGLTIKATVHLSLTFAGQTVSTPPAGVPIQFDWLPPDNQGIEKMKARLHAVLLGGNPGQRDAGVLSTLLDHPLIDATATTQDLIAGLRAWEQRGETILKHYEATQQPAEALVDYALTLFPKHDHLRARVLIKSKSLHDRRLIEPLKMWAMSEQGYQGTEVALELLSKQIDLAPDRDALTAELGKVWLARSPLVLDDDVRAGDPWKWRRNIRLLSLTHDRNLLPHLRPFLERKQVALDARNTEVDNDGISTRVCDLTYNMILNLLEREGERFAIKAVVGRRNHGDAKAEYARRDALIAKLKQELTTPDPAKIPK